MSIHEIRKAIEQGDFNEALRFIQKVPEDDEINANILKCKIYELTGKYHESYDLAEQVIIAAKKPQEIVAAMIAKASALWRLGELDRALGVVKKVERLQERMDVDLAIERDLLYTKSSIQADAGHREMAMQTQIQALEVAIKMGNDYLIGESANHLAVITRYLGLLKEAKHYGEQCLEINKRLGNEQKQAWTLGNLGEVYRLQGDHETALQNYLQSVEILERFNDRRNIAEGLHYIALTYWAKGDEALTLEYNLKALSIVKDIGNDIDTARHLFFIISVYIELGDIEKARNYYQQLEIIAKNTTSHYVELVDRFATALFLKISKRFKSVVEASAIFDEILEAEVINQEYTVNAMLYKCEILLDEVTAYGSEDALQESIDLANKINEIAVDKNLPQLMIGSMLLKVRFALISEDLSEAEKVLQEARSYAVKQQLNKFVKRIDAEIDQFESEIKNWQDLAARAAPIHERIEYARLQNYITNMKKTSSEH